MGLFLVFALTFQFYSVSESLTFQTFNVKDIAESSVAAAVGNLKKIPDIIPSPEDVLQSGKNLIVGLPFQEALSMVNMFCSAALSSNAVSPRVTPDINQMNYLLKIGDEQISVPLSEPNKLWALKEFHPKLPLVMVATGFLTNFNEGIQVNRNLDVIYDAYRCRGGVNFVAVDTSGYVDTLYTWSALNTDEIGNAIATSLEELVNSYPLENIHLIGHSLGAHIVGSAGRHFNYKTDELISRITGLDPAHPCFNPGESLSSLGRGDADFVDIIHSNSGALGLRDPIGDADFFPNGVQPLPPGCLDIECAHRRASEFYAESVYPGNESNFLGVKCGSLSALNGNFCPKKGFPMGYAVPKNLKGNYFLKTNNKSPFGLNFNTKSKPLCNKS